MAYSFDSLGYAKRLRDVGVPQAQAEAHAEAARDFIMAELVTKSDLLATKHDLQATMGELRVELHNTTAELRNSLAEVRTELRNSVAELRANMETQSLRLTVRLGARDRGVGDDPEAHIAAQLTLPA
jgi:hypothetical protein